MAEPLTRLYGLVDLALATQFRVMIDRLCREGAARCLFAGDLSAATSRVSPHIVDLAQASDLQAQWLAEGNGRNWGVWMETPLPLHLAHRHVRRFLQVRLPDGSGPVLMRAWDPRVLSVLMAHADTAWAAALTRGQTRYAIERDGRFVWLKPLAAAQQEERNGRVPVVTSAQMAGFVAERRRSLAHIVQERCGTPPGKAALLIKEAFAAGMTTESETAECCLLLARSDGVGRSPRIHALLADPDVRPALKLYQIRHALAEERA